MQFVGYLVLPLLLISTSSFGQVPAASAIEKELLGSWQADVEGSNRTRTLKIVGARQKSEGVFSLDADFGWTDGEETVNSAEISQDSKERKLSVTAKSGAKISATQMPDGSFVGSFLFTNGQSKEISIKKKSSETGGILAIPNIESPSTDVPLSCAAFSGKWTGTWGYGVGQQWLSVFSIDARCVAKIAYLSHSGRPKNVVSVEIKDGKLSVVCGGSDTCTFSAKGDELWAAAYGSSGANNNAVFKKLPQ